MQYNTMQNQSSTSIEAMKSMHRDFTMADWKYEKLREEIVKFQSCLSDDVDVCVSMASLGGNVMMQVTNIGYQNPDLLYFYGFIDGNVAQLIQHASQLNFVLMAVDKEEPDRPPRRIGFMANENSECESEK